MKLAIHYPDFTNSFSTKWIEYCELKNINYIVVNCFDTNIISILKSNEITHLVWHFGQRWKDLLTARNILFSAESIGIKVFPNFYTCWHFDDKISQKYLLEANDIELAKTYVFYEKNDSYSFINNRSTFPIVSKLRRGSGSTSVKLISNRISARVLVSKMFGKGENPSSSIFFDTKKRLKKISNIQDLLTVGKKIIQRFTSMINGHNPLPFELGYVYFQEFIPGNNFDTRIIIIGNRAFAFRRFVRKNDFRASGSGNFDYSIKNINIDCVKKGFEIASKLKTQSIAIDFVFDNNNIKVLEISYCFVPRFYDACEGFWDSSLNFYRGSSFLEYAIIEDLINS